MAKVEVWNDNKFPHKEVFKGDTIAIPAGGKIVMEEDDAIDFRGQYFQIVKDGADVQTPQSYKKIRIGRKLTNEDLASEAVALDLVCQKCGYKATSKTDLDEHIKANHLEDLEDQELAEKIKRGPGRPKKEAN